MTPRSTSLKPALDAIGKAIDDRFDRALAVPDDSRADLYRAMRHAVMGGGKRMRPLLVVASCDLFHLDRERAMRVALAIEAVHCYSLVHDDLPCMDDDDMRRGRPTVHKVYGVPVATAAGLAMVPLAARSAWHAASAMGLSPEIAGDIVRELMVAAGAGGMIGGQLLDLEAEGAPLSLESLERVHRLKTGALIRASVTLGARASMASPERRHALDRYGASIGLAFQIADDVLDVTATTDQLGKTAGRDLDLHKSTYPALLGVEGATQRAVVLVEEGCAALDQVGLLTPTLEQLARFIVERRS